MSQLSKMYYPFSRARYQAVRAKQRMQQLEKATHAWSLPALMRSYSSNASGHEQFAAETLILAEHGYQPAMQSAESGHLRPLMLIAGRSKGKLSVTFTKTR